jgi:predicted phage terminase large subunit-like protein
MDDMNDRQLLTAFLREDLQAFTVRAFKTINPGVPFRDNWHLEAINFRLMECAKGENRRLLITQPPRSLKSICVSIAYVAWMLGRDPRQRFICVSYGSELAAELARQFRVVVDAPWYRDVFPSMQAAKNTSDEFVTSDGGGRFATSVGGTLTGRGADTIIIDDPMKAEDALSKAARDRVMGWYKNTLVTRLNDKLNGTIITVMQRLHEEDLAGHLIEQRTWTHLDLPAIAMEPEEIPLGDGHVYRRRPDEVLQPEHEPLEVLDRIKAEIGSLNFSAQYQQRPVPVEGNLIKWKWFQVYANRPAHNADGRIIQSWDTALKVGDQTDYSVCTTWLVKGPDYYLLHVLRQRLEFPTLRKAVIDMSHGWAAHHVLIEDKGSGTSLIQDMRYERGVRPIEITPEADKITRMGDQTACIEAKQVHLPEEAPWLDDFRSEVLAFPYGKHDDQVDSMSQFLKWVRNWQRNRARSGRCDGMY